MNRRVATRGIIVHQGKLLCVKLHASEADFWCVPGGGVDVGEPIEQALERELVEETGIRPKVGRLLFVQQFMAKKDLEETEFFFLIENPEDYLNIDLSQTTHGEEEIESIEFIDTKDSTKNILPKFLQEIDFDNLPESTEIYNYLG